MCKEEQSQCQIPVPGTADGSGALEEPGEGRSYSRVSPTPLLHIMEAGQKEGLSFPMTTPLLRKVPVAARGAGSVISPPQDSPPCGPPSCD
jgi:hypothetical protein